MYKPDIVIQSKCHWRDEISVSSTGPWVYIKIQDGAEGNKQIAVLTDDEALQLYRQMGELFQRQGLLEASHV